MTTKSGEATPKFIKDSQADILDAVKQRFSYDPDTGILTRKRTNKPCKALNNQGYYDVDLGDLYGKRTRNTRVHRVAWLIHYGEWPNGILDHINGDRTDNRIANLRLSDHRSNQANSKARKECSSRFKGVSLRESGKWISYIGIGKGQTQTLGLFGCETAAAIAYDMAARKRFGEFARLNFPVSGEMSAH